MARPPAGQRQCPPPPPHARCTPTHVPHTRDTHLHTRTLCPPCPTPQAERGNGSQAAPADSCGRMRSQVEDAEEGCGSRRFAAAGRTGGGAGRERGCCCQGDSGWGKGALRLRGMEPPHVGAARPASRAHTLRRAPLTTGPTPLPAELGCSSAVGVEALGQDLGRAPSLLLLSPLGHWVQAPWVWPPLARGWASVSCVSV